MSKRYYRFLDEMQEAFEELRDIDHPILSGFVVGRKHDFQQSKAVLDYHGQPLALGVQDLRSYVVSGDKDEDLAGLARSGYGIPYDIGTESSRPLAQEMADVIAAALRGSDATVKIVNLSPKMGRAEVARDDGVRPRINRCSCQCGSGRRTLTAPLVWPMTWN